VAKYASKTFSLSKQNYGQFKEEIVAILFGCECFHSYLYAHQEVIADIFYYKGIDYLATHGLLFLQISRSGSPL